MLKAHTKKYDFEHLMLNQISYYLLLPTPSNLKISSIRHHFVIEDCNKLAPTNKVNQIKLMLIKRKTTDFSRIQGVFSSRRGEATIMR